MLFPFNVIVGADGGGGGGGEVGAFGVGLESMLLRFSLLSSSEPLASASDNVGMWETKSETWVAMGVFAASESRVTSGRQTWSMITLCIRLCWWLVGILCGGKIYSCWEVQTGGDIFYGWCSEVDNDSTYLVLKRDMTYSLFASRWFACLCDVSGQL